MKEKILNYFKAYSNNECFATADGQLFHKKSDAISHASMLTDRKVTLHKRNENLPEVQFVVPAEEKPEEPAEEKLEEEKPGKAKGGKK